MRYLFGILVALAFLGSIRKVTVQFLVKECVDQQVMDLAEIACKVPAEWDQCQNYYGRRRNREVLANTVCKR